MNTDKRTQKNKKTVQHKTSKKEVQKPMANEIKQNGRGFSEAEIAVHWKEEELIYPPPTFVEL